MENPSRYFTDLKDEKIICRLNDYFKYDEEFFTNGTIPPAPYVAFVSWMALHECNAHMGEEESVSEIDDADIFSDNDCHFKSGLKIMGFHEIKPMQELQSLCGADYYKFNEATGLYEVFEPGFPNHHPTIEQQVEKFAANHPDMMNALARQIQTEKPKFIDENLNLN